MNIMPNYRSQIRCMSQRAVNSPPVTLKEGGVGEQWRQPPDQGQTYKS